MSLSDNDDPRGEASISRLFYSNNIHLANLTSASFLDTVKRLSPYKTAFILGIIEEANGDFYNCAVVIKQGKVLGSYRKVHLFEKNFVAGTDYPIFKVDSLTFGINICYDARFSEGAALLAEKGAEIIFYPLNNRLPREKAIAYREKHIPNLIDRASETRCWIVSSDVIGSDKTTLAYGCSAIVDSRGNVRARVLEQKAGMTTITLP